MSELNENEEQVETVEQVESEEERLAREEQERLQREQLERERAEEARLKAEEEAREQARLEHEALLNSFPETTVFYRDLLENADGSKSLGMPMRNARQADMYGCLDKHFDMSELTYVGTESCGVYYLKGYEKPDPTEAEKMLAYEKKIEADIDNYLYELVSSRGYDDVKSCVGYYNSTDETFQREARAISKHRDQLYRKGYDLIAQCEKGEIDYRIIDLQYILNLIDPLDW